MATVVGLFENTAQAQTAVEQLRSSGIDANNISVAMRSTETADTTTEVTTTDGGGAGGAVTGAVGGGLLGGLAGLLVGVGAIAIPGIGLTAGGPLAAALVGAGIGAAAGGLVGALVDAGVPEEEATLYETGVQRGGVLVTARVPDGQDDMARNVLNSNGARDIRNDSSMYNDPDYRYGSTSGSMSGGHDSGGVAGEAVGGAGGAVAGGVIGAAVGGPVGAVVGAGIGAAGGGALADEAEGDKPNVGLESGDMGDGGTHMHSDGTMHRNG